MNDSIADVCLLSEGAYPYAVGGVSSWVQSLIAAHPDLTFQLLAILPDHQPRPMNYRLPENVVGLHHVYLNQVGDGPAAAPGRMNGTLKSLRDPLLALQRPNGDLEDLADVITELSRLHPSHLGRHTLLDSRAAWELVLDMYQEALPNGPFLDYFWTCRCLLGGLFSCLVAPLPPARVYHTVSTGYAGLLAARAKLTMGCAVLLTEHGIYTNERRIEITMADWLNGGSVVALAMDSGRKLADVWKDSFASYARACYSASDRILTLYAGNQELQRQDGAPEEKLGIIPNGVDFDAYSAIPRSTEPRPPTVALIGRVVVIKDIKTYIRACVRLRREIPNLLALVLGPTDEEPGYYRECMALVHELGASDTVRFTGRVDPKDYLGHIDALVLTSTSEAQPLTVLEAGAAGVPCVVTDVGACREMVLGRGDETPALGPGGAVTEPADPTATAHALARLLTDADWHTRCGWAMQERVRRYYNKSAIDERYRALYQGMAKEAVWPASVSR